VRRPGTRELPWRSPMRPWRLAERFGARRPAAGGLGQAFLEQPWSPILRLPPNSARCWIGSTDPINADLYRRQEAHFDRSKAAALGPPPSLPGRAPQPEPSVHHFPWRGLPNIRLFGGAAERGGMLAILQVSFDLGILQGPDCYLAGNLTTLWTLDNLKILQRSLTKA